MSILDLRNKKLHFPISVNLNNKGVLDYGDWGYSAAGDFSHRSSTSLISDITPSGGATLGQWAGGVMEPDKTFSGATGDNAAATNTPTAVYFSGNAAESISFTVDAVDTNLRRLYILAAAYAGEIVLTAALAGASSQQVTLNDFYGTDWRLIAIDFMADDAADNLTITLTKSDADPCWGVLSAAWLMGAARNYVFRAYDDDGDEANHTALGAENQDITLALNKNFRPRLGICSDGEDVASQSYQLLSKPSTDADSAYKPVHTNQSYLDDIYPEGVMQVPSVRGDASGTNASNTVTFDVSTAEFTFVAGQIVIAKINKREAGITISIADDGGQSWTTLTEQESAATATETSQMFYCEFDGTWDSDPSFTVAGGNAAEPMNGSLSAWNGIDGADIIDVAHSSTTRADENPSVITGINTNTDKAAVLFFVTSDNDTAWTCNTAGWKEISGNEGVRNTSGNDLGNAVFWRIVPIAGASGSLSLIPRTQPGKGTVHKLALKPRTVTKPNYLVDSPHFVDGTPTTNLLSAP